MRTFEYAMLAIFAIAMAGYIADNVAEHVSSSLTQSAELIRTAGR